MPIVLGIVGESTRIDTEVIALVFGIQKKAA